MRKRDEISLATLGFSGVMMQRIFSDVVCDLNSFEGDMEIEGNLIAMPQGTCADLAVAFSVDAYLQLYVLQFDEYLLPKVRSLVGKSVVATGAQFGGSFRMDSIDEWVPPNVKPVNRKFTFPVPGESDIQVVVSEGLNDLDAWVMVDVALRSYIGLNKEAKNDDGRVVSQARTQSRIQTGRAG